MEILSCLRKSCKSLRIAATVAFASLVVPEVEARETYAELANRLLQRPPNGAEVRSDIESMVLQATNAYRASKKLPPLKLGNAVLKMGARAHAMDLFAEAGMGHVSSAGHSFESRMRALNKGQMFMAPMAENAARLRNSTLGDAQKAQALVNQWIKSAGHRRNMTNRTYITIAVGVVTQGDDVYAVQIFSGPEVKTNLTGAVQ